MKENPKTAAVISKLTAPRERPTYTSLGKQVEYTINQTQLSELSQSISQRINDNSSIFQLFPDLDLAAQILISSILSPKDMTGCNLIYKIEKDEIPQTLNAKIVNIIKTEVDVNYKLRDKLPIILRDMLFISGAYCEAVIPESVVDQLINTTEKLSMEDYKEITNWAKSPGTLGFLGAINTQGRNNRLGLEALDVSPNSSYNGKLHVRDEKTNAWGVWKEAVEHLDISDDYRLLRLPHLTRKAREGTIRDIISSLSSSSQAISMEANKDNKKLTNREFSSLIYKGAKTDTKPFVVVPTLEKTVRHSVSRPLVLKFPTESVIPIHTPGDHLNHIGYFVLLDAEGHPITKAILDPSKQESMTLLGDQSATMSSMLINRARQNLEDTTSNDVMIDKAAEIYANIVEADLLERLKNGIYGNNVTISRNNEIYRVMLSRALANQYTRILYVPREIMSYMAFNHYENGTGKSLLDDLRVLLSLRAIIMFAKVMALTKNAIAVTNVNMTLDENDPDPVKTIEIAIHEITRMRQQYFPLGINSPVDLVDWIQRAGLQFTFEGHPAIPTTKLDFENKNMQFQVPDTELDEMLRKVTYMSLGLSPETVDNGFNSEFATTVVSNNILLSKRIMVYQDNFTPQLSEQTKKYIHNDPFIHNKIKAEIKNSKDLIKKSLDEKAQERMAEDEEAFLDQYYLDIVSNVTAQLPKPDITTIETQTTAFDQYSESLDKTLEAWISTSFITEGVAGQLTGFVDTLKATFKAYYLRKWMVDNGFMSELGDITTSDKDGNPIIDLYNTMKDHLDGIIRSSVEYVKNMQDMAGAADKDLKGIEPGESTGSYSDTSSGSDDFGGGDFGDMGGGDMGLGDLGGDLGGTGESGSGNSEEGSSNDNVI